MIGKTRHTFFYMMLVSIMLVFSAQITFGQQDQVRPRRVSKATSVRTIPNGESVRIKGNVTRIGENSFAICEMNGAETVVQIDGSTKVETHRRGVLRGAETLDKGALLVGLTLEVKGKGNEAGELVAKWVRFHDSMLKAAMAVDARAIPLEREQDRMAGQLDETTVVATNALAAAKTAQDAADKAQQSAEQAQGTADTAKAAAATAHQVALTAHERISAIDDFEATESLTITFKAGSAVLTKEAKAQLDEFAAKTASAKGFLVEVTAFASSEGSTSANHRLSELRAHAVKDYLIEAGKVIPRRISDPYGGGESNPMADNKTREGRMQNRRAEVKLLVSKGLATTEPVSASSH